MPNCVDRGIQANVSAMLYATKTIAKRRFHIASGFGPSCSSTSYPRRLRSLDRTDLATSRLLFTLSRLPKMAWRNGWYYFQSYRFPPDISPIYIPSLSICQKHHCYLLFRMDSQERQLDFRDRVSTDSERYDCTGKEATNRGLQRERSVFPCADAGRSAHHAVGMKDWRTCCSPFFT